MAIELSKIINLIDYTNLNNSEGVKEITELCHHANTVLGPVAAVCIYPEFVNLAKKLLTTTPIKVATVCNFPAGTATLSDTLAEIKIALEAGADEIDLVMPYHAYLKGEKDYVREFIATCKLAVGNKLLKVILETGALESPLIIEEASHDAIIAGADFIKTSTGKINIGATLPAATVMLNAIKNSGKKIGFKAAGGIRNLNEANAYLNLVEHILGTAWLTPRYFRLGASQLLSALLKQH